MPKLRLMILLTLCAALLLAIGYWNIRPDSFDRAPRVSIDQAIDFYIDGATSIQYQADGSLHSELHSPHLEHLKQTDITLVNKPDLMLYRGTDYPWHVQSERAEVSPKGTEVELIDQVRVARTDEKGRPTIITSSRMTVFPDRNYAQTAQPVKIEAANGVTTATGMKAYLNEGRMLLDSNVRGQHEVRR